MEKKEVKQKYVEGEVKRLDMQIIIAQERLNMLISEKHKYLNIHVEVIS